MHRGNGHSFWAPWGVLLVAGCCGILGCSRELPLEPVTARPGASGAYVLCEGLWGHDNSVLARIELPDRVIPDVLAGTGLRLGDVGNDLQRRGDTLYVVVSGSRSIECFHVPTARWIGRIRLQQNRYPRQLCIVNDTLGVVTDLYGDAVTMVHLRRLEELSELCRVGPAPEGIARWQQMLFVANSGYGDYRAGEPRAGTVSVLYLFPLREEALLRVGPNVVSVLVHPRRARLYALYLHLPSMWERDSLGGVVEYDLPTLQERRRWRVRLTGYDAAWSSTGDTLLLLTREGVAGVDVREGISRAPFLVLRNPAPDTDAWYTVAVDGAARYWVGNARSYTVAGEVVLFSATGLVQGRFPVGVNPGAIVPF
jgi:hypothetical protein